MENKPRRIRPNVAVIILGLAIALFTVVSGIVPLLTHWHKQKPVSREVFGGIPGVFVLVFYMVIPAMLLYGAILFSYRVRNWERGGPDNRATTKKNVAKRLGDFRAGVYMQTLLRDPAAGVMHSLIYFSFLILLGVTTTLEIDHQLPNGAKFLHGGVYQGFSFVGDLAGVTFLVGIIWAIMRRYVQKPVPHPHQDQARARGHPRHLPGHRRHGVHHRDVPDRRSRAGRRSRSGRSSATRCPGSSSTSATSTAWHQAMWAIHVGVVRPLPGDPADHDDPPHVHVAAEHVPA